VGLLVGGQALAVVTGLASGETEPVGFFLGTGRRVDRRVFAGAHCALCSWCIVGAQPLSTWRKGRQSR